MKSKKLVRKHIQKQLDSGITQKGFAKAIGFENPNNVSMLLSDNYGTTLSLNRLPALASVCGLDDREIIQFALARVEDAGDNPVEINKETLVWLLKTFAKVAAEHHRTVACRAVSA